MEAANATLWDDLALLKGIIQVQDKEIQSTQQKVVDLTTCCMANNIVITGLVEQAEEKCVSIVKTFLTEKMKMDIQDNEIFVAHRIRKKQETVPM